MQIGPACSNCTLYAPVRTVATDGALTLRVLLDVSVLEAYAMHGRAHVATRAYPSKATAELGRVSLGWWPASEEEGPSASSGRQRAAVADVRVWRMGPGVEWLP